MCLNSALRYLLDKAQYLGLEFSLQPLLFPNKKTVTLLRVKLLIQLWIALVGKDLKFIYYLPNYTMDAFFKAYTLVTVYENIFSDSSKTCFPNDFIALPLNH